MVDSLGHVRALVFLALVFLALRWLGRVRPRPRQPSNVVEYPRNILYIGVAVCGVFVGFAVLASVHPFPGNLTLFPFYLLGFSLLGGYLILIYYRVWFKFDWQGMTYQRAFGRPQALRWSEVTRLRFATVASEFRIETSDGRRIKMPTMLVGLPALALTLLDELPKSSLDERTRKLLEAVAAQA